MHGIENHARCKKRRSKIFGQVIFRINKLGLHVRVENSGHQGRDVLGKVCRFVLQTGAGKHLIVNIRIVRSPEDVGEERVSHFIVEQQNSALFPITTQTLVRTEHEGTSNEIDWVTEDVKNALLGGHGKPCNKIRVSCYLPTPPAIVVISLSIIGAVVKQEHFKDLEEAQFLNGSLAPLNQNCSGIGCCVDQEFTHSDKGMSVVSGSVPVDVGIKALDLTTDFNTLAREIACCETFGRFSPEVVKLITLLFSNKV